jgi:hypothetical protein
MVLASDDIVEDGLSIASKVRIELCTIIFLVEPAPMPRIPSEFPTRCAQKASLVLRAKRLSTAASGRSVRSRHKPKLTFIPASSSSRHVGSTSHRLLSLDWRP